MATNAAQFTIIFTALDKTTATFRQINKSVSGLTSPFAGIGRQLSALAQETGLTTLGERAVVVGEKFGALGHQIGGLIGPLAALGAAGATAGLFEMAKGAAEFGKQLYVGQQRTGIAADALAKLHFAGSTVGLDADKMDVSMERLNRTIAQTASGRNKQAAQIFRLMHISLFNTNHTLKDAITLLPELSKHFAANASIAEKTNAAMVLMGRSGAQMLPLFEMGGDEMRKLFATFEQMYGKITPEVLKSAREGAESFEVLKLAVHGLSFTIGSALFPVLKDIITPITGWIAAHRQLVATRVREWVTGVASALKSIDWSAVGSALMGFARALEAVGRVLGPFWSTMAVAGVIFAPLVSGALGAAWALGRLGLAFGGVAIRLAAFAIGGGLPTLMVNLAALTETTLPALSAAFLSLGVAIEATPVGWIITGIAAIAGGTYLLYKYWTPITSFFSGVWDDVTDAFRWAKFFIIGAADDLGQAARPLMKYWTAVTDFFRGLWHGVVGWFEWAWQKIKPIIDPILAAAKFLANFTGLTTAYNVASQVTQVVVHKVVQVAQASAQWAQNIEQHGEAVRRLGNVSRLASLIASGEGSYSSVNLGQRGGYRSATVPLGNMTLAQVMAAQSAHQFNAAGRYQVIASTLRSAVAALHLNTKDKFDASMQDRIFKQFLLGMKHPEIANFLSGRSNNVMAAARAAALEWASIADPATGKSHYAGIGNNRASIPASAIVQALQDARVPTGDTRIPVTSRPIISGRSGGLAGGEKNKTDITVTLANVPPGSRVASRSTGPDTPNLEVNRGRAWVN